MTLPIASATGVECACIPTALLSTHTAVFSGYAFTDLAGEILPIAEHWAREGIHFDGIFTGYMPSPQQGELIARAIRLLRSEDTLVMVDPAMADHGSYYHGLDDRIAEAFRSLLPEADIITPNVTEAAFLTSIPYREAPQDEEYVERLLQELGKLCHGIVTVTGIQYREHEVGTIAYNVRTGERSMVMDKAYPGAFHGAGDIFASAYGSLLIRGASLQDALECATKLVGDSVARTHAHGTPKHYGSDFEGALPEYIRRTEKLFAGENAVDKVL